MRPRRFLIVTLWLAFLVACGVVVRHTPFTADLTVFLPQSPTPEQQLLVDQLRHGALSRLILIGITGTDPATRADIDRHMAHRLLAMPEFASVHDGEPLNRTSDQAWLFANRYLLSATVTPQRFTTGGLRAAIGENVEMLASPLGLLIKPLIIHDPTGEMLQLLTQFNDRPQPRTADGVWVSRDGERALLLVQTTAAVSDTDAQQRALAVVRQAFQAAEAGHIPPARPARLEMTGPGVFSVTARDTIRQEVERLSVISTTIVVLLLLAVYRSFLALALGLLPVATGVLAGVAAVSLGFGTVHGLTLGFGITLIGEAVDYAIYFFLQSERTAPPGTDTARPWTTVFWPTVRLGAALSVIGFATLLLSSFPGLAQLGLYSVAGLLAAAAVTRYVLPALWSPTSALYDVAPFGVLLARLTQRIIRLRPVVAVLVLAAGAGVYSQRHVLWSADLSALSPLSPTEQTWDATLRRDLAVPDPRYLVVVSGESQESALNAAHAVAERLDPLVKAGVLGGYDSPTRYLPSVAMQRMRQDALPPPDTLAERLRAATATLPLRAERLGPFLADVEAARHRAPLQRRDLAGTSLALGADALLMPQGGRWRAVLPLQPPTDGPASSHIDPERIRRTLAPLGPEVRFMDVKATLDGLYAAYLQEALHLSLLGLAALVGLLLISLRSLRRVAALVAPLLSAVVLVTAGLVGTGQRLTLLHLIGLLLIVAIGSNYALFFDRRPTGMPAGHHARTLASLLFANLTTVFVFGLLAFSRVPVLKAIGSTVAPGVVLALFLSAVFLGRRVASPTAPPSG